MLPFPDRGQRPGERGPQTNGLGVWATAQLTFGAGSVRRGGCPVHGIPGSDPLDDCSPSPSKSRPSKPCPDVPRRHKSALVEDLRTAASTVALRGQDWGTESKGAQGGTGLCPKAQVNSWLGSSPSPPAAPAGSISGGSALADSPAPTPLTKVRENKSALRGPSPGRRQDSVEKSQALLAQGLVAPQGDGSPPLCPEPSPPSGACHPIGCGLHCHFQKPRE